MAPYLESVTWTQPPKNVVASVLARLRNVAREA
jgi:hypothetical protein